VLSGFVGLEKLVDMLVVVVLVEPMFGLLGVGRPVVNIVVVPKHCVGCGNVARLVGKLFVVLLV
jgi:hypothetical protein